MNPLIRDDLVPISFYHF